MRPTVFFPFLALFMVAACEDPTVLLPKTYTELPGWAADNHAAAYQVFVESCMRNEARRTPYRTKRGDLIGDGVRWNEVCGAAYDAPNLDDASARAFFEQHFVPFQVTTASKPLGLVTGYYEPLLHGSKTRHGRYQTPVYGVPKDLRAGEPYLTREEIVAGEIKGRAPVLLYVDDPVMLFFLHIQGSGKVQLENGSMVGLQYAAQNGHSFVPIGRLLKESGELENASMQSIRDWLHDNPDRADAVMNQNPSYIFFTLSSGSEMAKGALGIPLTALRSVAVDDDRAAYGVPTYLAVDHYDYDTKGYQPLERLFVSQDTGGALKGPNRIDIFFGRGAAAEWEAGHQSARGLVYWLLPKEEKPADTDKKEDASAAPGV